MDGSKRSVSIWLDDARKGDESAKMDLWARYYQRLVTVAKHKLGARQRRVADEEDIVATVFEAFFRAMEAGRFEDVADRSGLFRVLLAITENKVKDHYRRETRGKRGGGNVHGHSAFIDSDGDQYDQIPDPSPDFALDFTVACRDMLGMLNEDLQRIAIWKLEGFTNREIALRLGKVEETIRRKVSAIRNSWEQGA